MYSTFANFIQKIFKIDAHYFLKGGFWLTLGQFFTIIFGLLSTTLFAHFLTETEYGLYKYLLNLATIFSAFSLTGLGQAILQATAKGFYGFYKNTIKINFIYSLFISTIAIIGALYYYLNENVTIATGCIIISFFQPLIITYKFLPIYLQGSKKFEQSTKVLLIRIFFVTTTSTIMLFTTRNILVLLTTYLLSTLIINLISHILYKQDNTKVSEKTLIRHLSYAKHSSLRNIISLIGLKLDTIIIFIYLGAHQLAIYSIAVVIPDQIKGLLKNLASLLVQKYSKHTDKEKLLKSVPKRSVELFLILTFLTIFYILFSPYLYGFLFPKYSESIFYSQLYSLIFLTHVFYIPYSILQANMEEIKLYYLSIFSSIFLITLLIILIPKYEIFGAIISVLIYRIIFAAVTFISLIKEKPVFINKDKNIKQK